MGTSKICPVCKSWKKGTTFRKLPGLDQTRACGSCYQSWKRSRQTEGGLEPPAREGPVVPSEQPAHREGGQVVVNPRTCFFYSAVWPTPVDALRALDIKIF